MASETTTAAARHVVVVVVLARAIGGSMNWIRSCIAAGMLAVVLTGCTGEPSNSTAGPGATPGVSPPGSASDAALVPARYPQCDVGQKILRYLETGDNRGDPALDLAFADAVGVSKPQARAIASRYVQQCDERAYADEVLASNAEASRAQSSRDAEERAMKAAQDQEAEQAMHAKEAQSCATIGGRYADDLCYSTVTGNPSGRAGAECVYPDGTPRWVGFVNGEIDSAFYINEKDLGCFR